MSREYIHVYVCTQLQGAPKQYIHVHFLIAQLMFLFGFNPLELVIQSVCTVLGRPVFNVLRGRAGVNAEKRGPLRNNMGFIFYLNQVKVSIGNLAPSKF